MLVSEFLKRVRKLIESPACWTQGVFARTATGREVEINHTEACCFCLDGAIMRTSRDLCKDASFADRHRILGASGLAERMLHSKANERRCVSKNRAYHGYVEFNDENDHAAVIQFLDDAIETATYHYDKLVEPSAV